MKNETIKDIRIENKVEDSFEFMERMKKARAYSQLQYQKEVNNYMQEMFRYNRG